MKQEHKLVKIRHILSKVFFWDFHMGLVVCCCHHVAIKFFSIVCVVSHCSNALITSIACKCLVFPLATMTCYCTWLSQQQLISVVWFGFYLFIFCNVLLMLSFQKCIHVYHGSLTSRAHEVVTEVISSHQRHLLRDRHRPTLTGAAETFSGTAGKKKTTQIPTGSMWGEAGMMWV